MSGVEAETVKEVAASEAFFVFLGITFGPVDIAILVVLAVGGVYWLYSRSKTNPNDAADRFKQYSIQ